MKNLLKTELYKAFHNLSFFVTFSTALVIVLWSAMECIHEYYRMESFFKDLQYTKNLGYPTYTLYCNWIGGEFITAASTLFYFLLPLMAAFPYGWSLVQEQRNAYIQNVVSRAGAKRYYGAKYLANFIVAGVTIGLPLLLNFIVVACFIPARLPDSIYQVYYAVFGQDMWALLFYTNPLLYDLLYFLLAILFAGLWAQLSFVLAAHFKRQAAVLLLPYLFLLIFHYVWYSQITYWFKAEGSPICFLRGVEIGQPTVWWVVLIEMGILFFFTGGVLLKRSLRDDIF